MADGRPALFKEYPRAERILLPRHPIRLDTPLEDVLHRRRTHRAFTGQPVPLAVLSTLVHTVFAPVDTSMPGLLARLSGEPAPLAAPVRAGGPRAVSLQQSGTLVGAATPGGHRGPGRSDRGRAGRA
jgi:hypothetical protein